jgi:hypothetical protein
MLHLAFLALLAPAQEPANLPTSSGVLMTRGESRVILQGEFRLRAESRDPEFPLAGVDRESASSGRFRLGFRGEVGEHLAASVLFQKSVLDQGEDSEDFVHEAVLAWSAIADLADLEVGRFEMAYGSGLLVGTDDWSPTGRAFDGVRLMRRGSSYRADLFWTQPVEAQAVPEGVDQSFGGVWVEFPRAPLAIEVYGLARNDNSASTLDLADTTVGARVRSGADQDWSWSAEAAVQFGEHGPADAGGLLAALHGGMPLPGAFRAGAGLLYASGDDDPADADDEAFAPLYEESHAILGLQDIVSLTNVLDVYADASYDVDGNWTIGAAVHFLRLAQDNGLPPVAGVTGIVGESNLGSELDVWLSGHLMQQFELVLGGAQFFAGDAIADGDDQLWAFVQALFWF